MTTRRYVTSRDLKSGKGPNGRPVCRWCGAETTPPRKTWCGDECVSAYLARSSGGPLRRAAYERDGGVCTLCGCDCLKVKRVINAAIAAYVAMRMPKLVGSHAWGLRVAPAARPIVDLFVSLGWSRNRIENSDSLWDADHVQAVVDGGGQCGPENIRTLCLPCHKAETATLARRRAKERRDAKRALLPIES